MASERVISALIFSGGTALRAARLICWASSPISSTGLDRGRGEVVSYRPDVVLLGGKLAPQYCFQQASMPCQQALFSCQRACSGSVQIPGGCPGEVPPQKCPYDCQMWNPASQSCIGPTMNGCPPMQANLANTIDDLHTASAAADAEKAKAHVADLKAKSEAKSKAKGKTKKK